MQLNKVLKGLMIALPVMAIAACSSNKNASNDGSEGMLGAGTGMDANGGNGNMSSEEQARLQMQQLQQNNIVYFDLELNKVLKGLMIALFSNSGKNASNDGSEGMLGAGTGMQRGNGNMSFRRA